MCGCAFHFFMNFLVNSVNVLYFLIPLGRKIVSCKEVV